MIILCNKCGKELTAASTVHADDECNTVIRRRVCKNCKNVTFTREIEDETAREIYNKYYRDLRLKNKN